MRFHPIRLQVKCHHTSVHPREPGLPASRSPHNVQEKAQSKFNFPLFFFPGVISYCTKISRQLLCHFIHCHFCFIQQHGASALKNLLTRVIFIFLTHKMEIVISFWAYQGYHGKIKPSNYNIGYESTSNNSKDDKTVDDPLLHKILVTNSNSTTLVLNNRLLRFS